MAVKAVITQSFGTIPWQRGFIPKSGVLALRDALLAACALLTSFASSGEEWGVDVNERATCRASAHRLDDVLHARNAPWPRQGEVTALEASCWVSASHLPSPLPGANEASWILVDVRSRNARDVSPIPNALQIELSEIGNKRFLQHESVVLIGTGLDFSMLNTACTTLQRQGFHQLRALHGGFPAWQQATGKIPETNVPGARVQSIFPSDWIASLRQGIRWTVLAASSSFLEAAPEHQPVPFQQIIPLPYMDAEVSVQGFDKASSALIRTYQHLQMPQSSVGAVIPEAVLVVTESALSRGQHQQLERSLERVASEGRGLPVYLMLGGWRAYVQQVTQTAAIRQTANHKLQAACGRN